MISLETGGILARYFVWSCDHLPLTTAWYTVEIDGRNVERPRRGAHYIEHGTTLCHIFWAILWMPLISVALISLVGFMVGSAHVMSHINYMRYHPDAGPIASVVTYFIPEIFVVFIVGSGGLIFLAVVGGSKMGFFSLFWQYLKGIKQRVCPLVRFGGNP